jgi:hypothetical protein
MPVAEIMKEVSARWARTLKENKKAYEIEAQKDKQRYERELFEVKQRKRLMPVPPKEEKSRTSNVITLTLSRSKSTVESSFICIDHEHPVMYATSPSIEEEEEVGSNQYISPEEQEEYDYLCTSPFKEIHVVYGNNIDPILTRKESHDIRIIDEDIQGFVPQIHRKSDDCLDPILMEEGNIQYGETTTSTNDAMNQPIMF